MLASWFRGLFRGLSVISIFVLSVASLPAQVRLAAPSYQAPGTPPWAGWAAPAQSVGIMIVNLNNGDDETYYPSVDRAIRETRRRGIFVIGYTYTGYGTRDPKIVRHKIDAVFDNYLVDGIFFDETPTDCNTSNSYFPSQFLYYQELTNYVRQKTGARLTVLNLGTPSPSDCWMGITNILVNWESQGFATYRDGFVDFPWVHKYPPERFWHIIYGMGPDHLQPAFELAKQRNTGWLYLTNEISNPYASAPEYWSAESDAVIAQAVQAPFATAWPDSLDSSGSRLPGRISLRWSSTAGARWQIFFDTDQSPQTGYHGAGLSVGAEYLLQGDVGSARLLRYTGSGSDWSWAEVAGHSELNALDGGVFTAGLDTDSLGGTNQLNYQIRTVDASGTPLGDSYVLPLAMSNTALVFDILNHSTK